MSPVYVPSPVSEKKILQIALKELLQVMQLINGISGPRVLPLSFLLV